MLLPQAPGVLRGRSADPMGRSRELLRLVAAGEHDPVLWLYQPPPTVAFGRRETHHAGYPAAVEAARRRGFEPVVRNTGGLAVAYGEWSLVVELIAADPSPPSRLTARFVAFAEALAAALRSLGVAAAVGRLDGEYCPGDYSVLGGVIGSDAGTGRVKLAGTAQRLVARAWLCSASIVVAGAEPLRQVLGEVYRELEFDWRPETLGAVEDLVPSVTMTGVEAAVVETLGGAGGAGGGGGGGGGALGGTP